VKGVDWLSRLIFDEDNDDMLVAGFHAVCTSLSCILKSKFKTAHYFHLLLLVGPLEGVQNIVYVCMSVCLFI